MNISGTSRIYLNYIYSKSLIYLGYISNEYMSDISQAYPGRSRVYHRYRLALYEVNLIHILLISWVHIRQISSISWISPKYLGYILRISQPWVQIQIRYISDSYLRYILHLVLKKFFGIFNLYLTGIFKAYMRHIISKSQA